MANPNIVNVANIYAYTAVQNATTTPTAIVTNNAGSNTVVKVDGLYCSNTNSATQFLVTIDLYRSSTAYNVATQIAIPYNATLDVLSKQIWLQEGDSLRVTANAASAITAVCSYEVIS